MQQKDMRVGMEVAATGYGGKLRRVKVKRLGVRRNYSRRNDGVEVEFMESPGYDHPAPGATTVLQSRDIAMSWEKASPIVAEKQKASEERERLEAEAKERARSIADRIARATGVEANVAVDRVGRELGRDRANKLIRQPFGDRMKIDTAAIEALLDKLGQ